MNKNDSGQSGSSAVLSEYFTPKSAMDESLSDFQETKKSCAGPKNTAKSKSSKPKKALKRVRGQKDIRKVLRSTKNDLQTYSEDFDKVCKNAGLDVDSEQLQLAIALSKSLQNTESTSNETARLHNCTVTTNTQERVNKIRTTLQEYGFKVPEVKIPVNARKLGKRRKNYKLILTSESQKKEIIADKYCQLLFRNITQFSLYNSDVDPSDIPLYHLASNVTYDVLRLTDTFYVNNLIVKSTSTGNLLRDWSEIPGRPVSPKLFEQSNMDFSEIECSQDELDIVLSGSLKSCRNVFRNKNKDLFSDNPCKIVVTEENSDNNLGNKNPGDHDETLKSDNNVTINVAESSSTNKYRSCSPDMFDDDASSLFDNSKNSIAQEEGNSSEVKRLITNTNYEVVDLIECDKNKLSEPDHSVCGDSRSIILNSDIMKRKSNNLMDITECMPIESNNKITIFHKTGSRLSQNSNITKRRSNDFMEITVCVGALSQPEHDHIDLTQNPEVIKEYTEFILDKDENLDEAYKTNHIQEPIKLTGSPKHNKIDLTGSLENDEDEVETNTRISKNPKEGNPDENVESMDMTQSSNTSDELPFVSLTATKSNSLDDTIIVDINDYADINRKITILQNQDEHIDLTQYSEINNEASNQSQSFFEDYIHNHSGNSEEPPETNAVNANYKQCEPGKVSVIQSQKRKSSSGCANGYESSIRSNSEENYSNTDAVNVVHTQRLGKTPSIKQNSSDIIVESETVKLNYNSESKLCESDNVDLKCPIKKSQGNEVSDIDLTQNSDTSEELSQNLSKCDKEKDKYISVYEISEPDTANNLRRCSSLGKIDGVSIDYDDFLKSDNEENNSKNTSSKSLIHEVSDDNIERLSKDNSFVSNCSQTSEVFEISDKELDYSIHQSKLEVPVGNFAFGGISIMDELSNFGTSKKSADFEDKSIDKYLYEIRNDSLPIFNAKKNTCKEISPIKHRRITEISTPQKACSSNTVSVVTPRNSELLIKTNNITPILNYESMSTPEIHTELDKYGIKPFKRKRAIQLLTHIYHQTHPIIETCTDELASPPKRRKLNDDTLTAARKRITPRKLLRPPRVVEECDKCRNKNVKKHIPETSKEGTKVTKKNGVIDKGIESNVNKKKIGKRKGKNSLVNQKKSAPGRIEDRTEVIESINKEIVTTGTPILKDIECNPEDWVFQKREKTKVHSCRVPLHIAFYNYVASRRDLREAILCYEPVEIDAIHKDLVRYGHRYDPKDLLKFLDKKCITVKTTDNDARNQKRS